MPQGRMSSGKSPAKKGQRRRSRVGVAGAKKVAARTVNKQRSQKRKRTGRSAGRATP